MSRLRLLLLLLALAATVGAFATLRLRERLHASARPAALLAARPPRPDLAKTPAPFRARLDSADTRLAAGDLAALAELARLYHANGFLAEAGQAYRALLDLAPDDPRWPHLLAVLLADYGRLDDSLPLLQRVVALAPDYLPGRLRLADTLVKAGQPAAATAAYEATLTRAPAEPYALLGLARLALDAGQPAAARDRLRAALAARPDFSAAHSLLATAADRLGDDATAKAERATASAQGRFRPAPDPWVDALSRFCYDVYRLQVTAAAFVAGHEWAAAQPPLERALALAPENPATLRQLGKVLLARGDFLRARMLLEQAVVLDPRNPAAYLDLIVAYRATQDLAAGVQLLERALALLPDEAGLHYEYGAALLALRRPADAALHFDRARRLNPANPLAARDLVSTYFRLGREADAAAVLEESLAQHPDFPPFLVMAARYRIMKADEPAAAALLARARAAGAIDNDLTHLAADFARRFGHPP